jgi:pimeloyl-ACP methyl ester carboxylesterase
MKRFLCSSKDFASMTSTNSSQTQANQAALAFGQSRVVRALAASLRSLDYLLPSAATRLAVNLFFTPLPLKFSLRKRLQSHWQLERVPVGNERVALMRAMPTRHEKRRKVLLVHGWAGHASQMQALGQALIDAGFDPVLFDLPAHGYSTGLRCTMPDILHSLHAVQAHAGPFEAVVAHSMGVLGCLHALTGTMTARCLVAIAPSSSPREVFRWFSKLFGLSPSMVERMREHIKSSVGMKMEEFETQWLGSRVHLPTLVIHDADDRMAPLQNGQALAGALPQARLHTTKGLSHRRVLSCPSTIALAVAHVVAHTTNNG